MVLMGDEYGHTKKGNNNTYCHDSEVSAVTRVAKVGGRKAVLGS